MSEADTPNNPSLPESAASTDDSTVELSHSLDNSEEPKVVNLFQLPPAKDVEQHSDLEITLEADSTILSDSEEGDPDSQDRSRPESHANADWFALAQKMRQRNRRLLDQVRELKQALKTKQEALTTELVRSQERDHLITRQGEELHTLQDQLTRLFHTLESSHQAAQRQQILIETLSEQLQSSQERVAQLERECALTQQRHNEQSHQLMQAANTCRELRTRLHRQQQQTLQFKTALEKCLEMPATSLMEQQQARQERDRTQHPLMPKTQPIQPWSSQFSELEDSTDSYNPLWHHPTDVQSVSASSSEETIVEGTDWFFTPEIAPLETNLTASQDTIAAELAADEELLAQMNSLAEASGLADSGVNAEIADDSTLSWWENEESPLPEDRPLLEQEDNEEHETVNAQSQQPDAGIFSQSNWPSPVLNPLRRPKKIKSLAAIELPTFPRYRPT